ncbi:MAG: hypothetical protein QOG57_1070, partial [Pseudonocardiales bacterium]|nr:hypothetical protein [Pseudonocardiales bacterium]
MRYYAQVAPYLLPYLTDRPVNLHRFPNGVDKASVSKAPGAIVPNRPHSAASALGELQ